MQNSEINNFLNIMLVNNSDNSSSEMLLNRIRQHVYKIIRRRIHQPEDAEDITQNVLIRGWRSNEKNFDRLIFETEDDYLKYFSVIAMNELRRFRAEQLKINARFADEEELLALSAEELNPHYCMEIMQAICELPLKQRLALILSRPKLLFSFQSVFSNQTIAELLEINQGVLEKLANEIPLNDTGIKYVIETLSGRELKSAVRDERWKGRKILDRIRFRK